MATDPLGSGSSRLWRREEKVTKGSGIKGSSVLKVNLR